MNDPPIMIGKNPSKRGMKTLSSIMDSAGVRVGHKWDGVRRSFIFFSSTEEGILIRSTAPNPDF
jgi:hypothetical protein